MRSEKLGNSLEWRRLLLYSKGWFGEHSLVDDKKFFFAENGKSDPQAEIEATLTAFFGDGPEKDHPLCRFPARAFWLKKTLALDVQRMPQIKCKEVEDWLGEMQPVGISYVFSSYYPNNPASLFGHTFLRIHRSRGKSFGNPLLDLGASYAAYPTTNNPILYPIMGLGGMFPGKFDLSPYYFKVQEYNNAESRDLWEYELNLPSDAAMRIMLSMFELHNVYINYFYFDDNCAFLILKLLEVTDSKLDLTSQFHAWITPNESVQAIARVPGLVKHIDFRLSSRRAYLQRVNALSDAERDVMGNILSQQDVTLTKALPDDSRVRILDAIVEYIDFDEKLAGTRMAEKWKTLRSEVLKERSQIKLESPPLSREPPEREHPEVAAAPTRFGLKVGAQYKGRPYLEFNWRPALHDLASPGRGYSEELQIDFFETNFRYLLREKKFYLSRFHLLGITSTATSKPFLSPWSWSLLLASDSTCAGGCRRTYIRGGYGKTFQIVSPHFRASILALADIGFEKDLGWHLGPGIFANLIWNIAESITLSSQGFYVRHYPTRFDSTTLESFLSYAPDSHWEFRLGEIFENHVHRLEVSSYLYF